MLCSGVALRRLAEAEQLAVNETVVGSAPEAHSP